MSTAATNPGHPGHPDAADHEGTSDGDVHEQLLLGTHTDAAQNHLLHSQVRFSAKGKVSSQVEVLKRYRHEGEVNRARVSPQDDALVATASNSGTVYLYRLSDAEDNDTHIAQLKFHSENGYGLAWNKTVSNTLLSSADDGTVAIWDVADSTAKPRTFQPSSDIVNDVAWQDASGALFGAAAEDKQLYLYDTRVQGEAPTLTHNVHDAPINTLAFHGEYMVATGSSDHSVVLSDLRYIKRRLHTLIGHAGAVSTLHWAPTPALGGRVLASSGADRRVILWDLSRIGQEQSQEDAEDGAPELLFMHGGHTSAVTEFAWSKRTDWLAASVSDDNIVQVWQPTLGVVGRAPVDVADSDLE
ncbi:hypothetical protein DV451_001498 [Geotrichum candidum]|uniref:WD40 repeat-like protein n=1 Tax=Geotrichum candidum TaxID=1173061 RepID=A0A9P5KVK7_GEOCN|nr:hypothetical protein DV451_001498 [Geotrichum candidum]KAF5106357.1 hypothetical protein DV453_004009 [Geotrichum candidum]